jgi:hypothetical protein
MDGPSRNNRHYIVSQIDIELWAREQRRRWFARTFGEPLRKLAQVVLPALFRLVACSWQGRSRARRRYDRLAADQQADCAAGKLGARESTRSSP